MLKWATCLRCNYTSIPTICIGGIYSLPSFLSPETKYLLTSMLVVDPLKRITIAEIRQNAWFNVGLPEYLKPLPQGSNEDAFCNLQDDIITELMKKMNFPKETIIQALEERQNNQIKVAYQLVVDHRQMIENGMTFIYPWFILVHIDPSLSNCPSINITIYNLLSMVKFSITYVTTETIPKFLSYITSALECNGKGRFAQQIDSGVFSGVGIEIRP